MLKPSRPRTEFNIKKAALLAAVVGVLGGIAAEILEKLIGFVINLSFYQRLDTHIVPASGHQLGPLVIIVPAIGGLIIGADRQQGCQLYLAHPSRLWCWPLNCWCLNLAHVRLSP